MRHLLSPLAMGSHHLTGDYVWRLNKRRAETGTFRPCDERQTLSVLYNPNSLVTPSQAPISQMQ
jgi:hypothetical protein